MEVPKSVVQLVELFERNLGDYKRPAFNEAQLRQQFLDPFFEALGWDVSNKQGYAEQYKEVIHEDSVRIGATKRAPDYCFRIGRERKFFVEAKKPSTDIEHDKRGSYQLRRYAWSAKLPLSILADFEHFAIYDSRIRPAATDGAQVARIRILHFQELVSEWPFIFETFSKEGIQKGSFDRYATQKKKVKGVAEVDDDFLDSIEGWRAELAKDISRGNPALDEGDLNYLAQATIDRILFLRICEDRGIEVFGRLEALIAKKSNIYTALLEVFTEAQARYNSGLFYLSKEAGVNDYPDKLSRSIAVGDDVVKHIVQGLYFPKAPYEFSVFPADVLGQVYERFLGSRISTRGGKVTVSLKPEVKKAGGVYYTPAHIVRYIVDQTVRVALARLKATDRQLKFRVLDMACGSGSFLIEVYQAILDWYLVEYEKKAKAGAESKRLLRIPNKGAAGFNYRLSLDERKRILIEHVYGVDIDAQAVEVTKLSLLLKVLEDSDVVPRQLELSEFQQRLLPSLAFNILCGNSIVSTDVEGMAEDVLSEEERGRVSAFDWGGPRGFHNIVKGGGFDVIVGNPPYSYRNATLDKLKSYYLARYVCTEGNFDTYKFFIERAVHLLRPGGLLGQIVNSSFLIQPQFTKLREVMDRNIVLKELDVLGSNVFAGVTIDTAIFIGAKRSARSVADSVSNRVLVKEPKDPRQIATSGAYGISQRRFSANPGYVFDWRLTDEAHALVQRLIRDFKALAAFCDLSVGINTGSMKADMVSNRRVDARFHPCVRGTGISRYGPVITSGWIIYDPLFVKSYGSKGRTLPPERYFTENKILVVRTRNVSLDRRIVATLDVDGKYNLNRLSNIVAKPASNIFTVLGILNSTLVNWLFQTRFFNYEIKPVYLKQLPIATGCDNEVETLVRVRLELETDRGVAQSPKKQAALDTRILEIDRAIDERVFKLYDMSDRDRALVSDAVGTEEARGYDTYGSGDEESLELN